MKQQIYQELMEDHVRRRQMELWNIIVRNYTVDESLNRQVYKWIQDGTFHTQVQRYLSRRK
jgi:hypothetical protein